MKHIGIPLDPMLTLASTALIAAVAFIYLKRSSGNRLPPGPRPLPLVGNLFSMPSHSQWETYSKWSKKYSKYMARSFPTSNSSFSRLDSDILCANVLGTSIIILTSLEAATDLLEKRSAIYSDRPRSMMLELVGGGFSFTFMKYGKSPIFTTEIGSQVF
ncbi:hypothetical protein B0H19DRAFT_223072 [Mycena capillaripes]|nr:hypothetical protein B0H19DRAFT_223072 [Mycena capillaripes]